MAPHTKTFRIAAVQKKISKNRTLIFKKKKSCLKNINFIFLFCDLYAIFANLGFFISNRNNKMKVIPLLIIAIVFVSFAFAESGEDCVQYDVASCLQH